jgi:hypothetical protein
MWLDQGVLDQGVVDPGNVLVLHPQQTRGSLSIRSSSFGAMLVSGRLMGRWAAVCSCSGACVDVILLAPVGDGVGRLDVRDGSVQGVFNSICCSRVVVACMRPQPCCRIKCVWSVYVCLIHMIGVPASAGELLWCYWN